jgi:hypothetical protein
VRFHGISLALLVMASIAVGPSPAETPPPKWPLIKATNVLAGATSRSTLVINADVVLPNTCYSARIEHRTAVDPKSPGYFIESTQTQPGMCAMAIEECVVAHEFHMADMPSHVIVQSLDDEGHHLNRTLTVGATPPPHKLSTCVHSP